MVKKEFVFFKFFSDFTGKILPSFVSEGGMSNIVSQCNSFDQVFIQS